MTQGVAFPPEDWLSLRRTNPRDRKKWNEHVEKGKVFSVGVPEPARKVF
jgi:hypothetical protein